MEGIFKFQFSMQNFRSGSVTTTNFHGELRFTLKFEIVTCLKGRERGITWLFACSHGVYAGRKPKKWISFFEGARDLGHTPLNWHMRARIILHVARAMAYIHSQPPATDDRRFHTNVHGNIKPSNVFVGTDFSAYLSDYGFAQLARAVEIPSAHPKKPSLTTLEAGSVKKKPSQKGDVFDFGVMVIEVMGGARAPQQIHCILERIEEIRAGACHFFEYFVEGQAKVQALLVLEVALACTDCSPEARPSADDVLAALTDAFSASYYPG